ncbi:GPI transamidase component GAB1 [Psilocybe cubensis]|uniref:GPI transamidase component GAB1 n=1 Tax=Psilocybe cubensis TaxID=181762 RepID=A0ACB8HEC4_PSICU|nr:GPI transamidase component GAB1 [Psilocybe cubensis]KAH9485524.1 GPI transamidase component GAB1 [Psilocybe cubensis]
MSPTSKRPSSPEHSSFTPIFFLLIAVRLWISFTDVSEILKNDQQLSSPLTSFSQLKEGIFLFNHDIDPYSGGSFRHSPLLLSFFATVLPSSRRLASALWTASDAVGAWALVEIWRARQNLRRSSRDLLVAASYLLNPYLFLPSLALSTSSLENTALLLSIMFACNGKASASLFLLSSVIHLSFSSGVMLLPILLLLITDPHSHIASPKPLSTPLKKAYPLLGEFLFYMGILTLISTFVAGSWSWIPQTWGATLTLPDLAPNTGLWWYFFTEMFDHFRPFFLMVFTVHLFIYVVPVCLKFQHDALYAVFIMLGILGTFKPYTTLSDPGLFLTVFAIFPEIYPYMRYPIVTVLLHLHASLLMPLFHHLWLSQGTGNANFFYASTLVFACANGAALVDCIWPGLRIAIGPHVEGYSIVQE